MDTTNDRQGTGRRGAQLKVAAHQARVALRSLAALGFLINGSRQNN